MPQRAKRNADSAGLSEPQQSASRRRKASSKYGPTAASTRTAQASLPHTVDTLACEAVGWRSDEQHQQQGSQAHDPGQEFQHVGSIKGPQGYLQLLKAVSYQSQQLESQQTDQNPPNQRGLAAVPANGRQHHSQGDNLALEQQGSQQQQPQTQPKRRGWPKGKPRKPVSTVSGTCAAVGVAGNAADLAGVVECKDTTARSADLAECKDSAAAVATASPKGPLIQVQDVPRHNISAQHADARRPAAVRPVPKQQQQQYGQPVPKQQQQQQERDDRTESSGTSRTISQPHTHENAASTDSLPRSGPVVTALVAGRVPIDDDKLQALVSRKLSQIASSQLQGVLQQQQHQQQQSADSAVDAHSPMSDQSLLPADEALMVWQQQTQLQQQFGLSPAATAAAASSCQSPSKHAAFKVPVKPGHGSKGDDYQPTYKDSHRHVVICKDSSSVAADADAATAAASQLTVTPRLPTEFFSRYPLPHIHCNHSDAVLTPPTAAAAPDVMLDPDLTHLRFHTRAQDSTAQLQQQRRRQQQQRVETEKEVSGVDLQGCGMATRDHVLQLRQQQQLLLQRDVPPQVPDILAQLAEHLRQLSATASDHEARTGGILARQQQQMVNGSSDLANGHPHSSDRPMLQAAAVPATIATATDPAAATAGGGSQVSLERQASASSDLVAQALLQLQQQAAAAPLEGVSDGSCGTAEAQLQLPTHRSWPGRQQQQQRRAGANELHLPSLGAVFGGAAHAANHGSAAAAAAHGAMAVSGTQQRQQQQHKARESSSRKKGSLGHVAVQSQPQQQQQQWQSTKTPTLLQQLLQKRQQQKKLTLPGTTAASAADSGGSLGLSITKGSQRLSVPSLCGPKNSSKHRNSLQALQQAAATAAKIASPKALEAAPLATDPLRDAADLATYRGSPAAAVGAGVAAAAAAAAAESAVKARRGVAGRGKFKPAASAATGVLPNQPLGQQQQHQQRQLIQLQEVTSSMLSLVQQHQKQLQNVTVLLQQQQQQCGLGSNGGSGVNGDVWSAVHHLWEQQPQHIMSLLLCNQQLGRILMPQPQQQQQQQQQLKRLHNDQQQQQSSKRPSLDQSQMTQLSLLQHHEQQAVSSPLEGIVEALPYAAAAVPLASDPPLPSLPNGMYHVSLTQHTKAESLPATAAAAETAARSGAILPHASWSAADMAEAVATHANRAELEQPSQEHLQVGMHPATFNMTVHEEAIAATVIAAGGEPEADHTGTQASQHTAAAAGGGGAACSVEGINDTIGAVAGDVTTFATAADGDAALTDPAAAAQLLLLLAKQLLQLLQQFPAGLTTSGIRKLLLQRAAVTAAAAAAAGAAVAADAFVDGSSATAAWALEDNQMDCMVQQLLAARLIKQQQQTNLSGQPTGSSSNTNSLLVVTEVGRRILKLQSWWDWAQTIVTYLGDHGRSGLSKDYLTLVCATVDSQIVEGALRLCEILGLIIRIEPQQSEDGDIIALALCQQK